MIVKKSFNFSSRSILFFTLLLFGLAFILGCSKDSNDSTETEGPVGPTDPEVTESETPVGPSILKINCGGEELTYGSEVFQEDKYFTGESVAFFNPVATEIANTEKDILYLGQRNSGETLKTFGYNIPVTNGTYTVKFHFAEIAYGALNSPNYPGEEGRQVFSVDVEGKNKIKNLDIFKEVGALYAITRMYDVEVSDGELTISLEAFIGRPALAAIEIFGDGEIVID
jgi:hypothetical protein